MIGKLLNCYVRKWNLRRQILVYVLYQMQMKSVERFLVETLRLLLAFGCLILRSFYALPLGCTKCDFSVSETAGVRLINASIVDSAAVVILCCLYTK